MSDAYGEMHELRQQVFDITGIHMGALQFLHEHRLVCSLDKFKDCSFVRVSPVLDVPLRLLGGMEENQDAVDGDQSLWAQDSIMALTLLPKGGRSDSDSDELRESDDEELVGSLSTVSTHDEQATSGPDNSPPRHKTPMCWRLRV